MIRQLFHEPGAWLAVGVWALSAIYLTGMALRAAWRRRRPPDPTHAWARANVPGLANASDEAVAAFVADMLEDGDAAMAIHERK